MKKDIVKIITYNKYTNAKHEYKFDGVMDILSFNIDLYESLRDSNVFELNTMYIGLKGFRCKKGFYYDVEISLRLKFFHPSCCRSLLFTSHAKTGRQVRHTAAS